MGNQCPYPKYHYPNPAPNAFCWTEYVRQCSLNKSNAIKQYFNTYYKGKVVRWTGLPTSVSKSKVKFLMNPSEAEYTSSELTMTIDDKYQKTKKFTEKQEATFNARIGDYGGLSNHDVSFVPDDYSGDDMLGITYEEFLFYFSSDAQHSDNSLFSTHWKVCCSSFFVTYYYCLFHT